mgnify:CR=1 FL=1
MKWKNQNSMQTTNIKGQKYVMVGERINYLNSDNFPYHYSITSTKEYISEEKMWVVEVTLTIHRVHEVDSVYTGLASEVVGSSFINKTSALENAQTSAWGRAIAVAGIGYVGDDLASAEEMANTEREEETVEVMSNEILKFMLDYIAKGKGDKVKNRLPNYQISKAQMTKLEKAFKAHEVKEIKTTNNEKND